MSKFLWLIRRIKCMIRGAATISNKNNENDFYKLRIKEIDEVKISSNLISGLQMVNCHGLLKMAPCKTHLNATFTQKSSLDFSLMVTQNGLEIYKQNEGSGPVSLEKGVKTYIPLPDCFIAFRFSCN